MKSLNEAIGCWTTSQDGLIRLMGMVNDSVRFCAGATKKNRPEKLKEELLLLKSRLRTMQELCNDAIDRLEVIVETKELEK